MAPLLGLIFSRLGRILAHLGPILDRLGHLCWPILSDLGPSRLHLGAIFVPSWPTSAPSCAIVAPSWAHLGSILAMSCPILAPSLTVLGHFLQQLLSSPSLSNFLSNFSLSAGGLPPPPRTPPLSIRLLSKASGQEGSCLQFLASLCYHCSRALQLDPANPTPQPNIIC